MSAHAIVLVEGISDQRALATLARRRGRDLEAEGVSILPIGGAHAIGNYFERFGPRGLDLKVAGLCDVGEEGTFRHALERAGVGADLTRDAMEELGFYVCVTDLEDELVRALGSAAVLRIVEDYVIYPRLIGRHIDLHPLVVILAVLAGAELGGIAGIFVAVPVVALVMVAARHWLEWRSAALAAAAE